MMVDNARQMLQALEISFWPAQLNRPHRPLAHARGSVCAGHYLNPSRARQQAVDASQLDPERINAPGLQN
jgi:hypothetical protein